MRFGLYIHIPFCLSKCAYCDFASYPGRLDLLPAYVQGLAAEWRMHRALWAGNDIATVFIGGGTPSLLPPSLITDLTALFSSAHPAEVTMEANPGTLDTDKIDAFAAGGGTRLSLGLQTHEDRLLAVLGRAHRAVDVETAVTAARAGGIAHLNLDLIYGLPGQTLAGWAGTIAYAKSLRPDHLSLYQLELHADTPLHQEIHSGRLVLPDEEETADMLSLAMRDLPAAGFYQYEIASFARPGAECLHNLNYWHKGFYLGLGAGAHSYLNGRRWANTRLIDDYLAAVNTNASPVAFSEEIDAGADLLERLLLGLRLREGLALSPLRALAKEHMERFDATVAGLAADGLLACVYDRVRLTDRGILLADYVLRALARSLP